MFDAERTELNGEEYVLAKFYDDAVLGALVMEDKYIDAVTTIDVIDGILHTKGQTDNEQLRKVLVAVARYKGAS